MRFSIITPTYKRKDLLVRAVQSVLAQRYSDWEMIIVNDSPNDEAYRTFASSINDPRIHYHTNRTNGGVNFTRNTALDKVSSESDWVIFLDDDDYLAQDALQSIHELILTHPHKNWFITNRAHADGTLVTHIKKTNTSYSYIIDYLFLRRCRGDATHIINTQTLHKIRFSRYVKQAEEWIFFYQLGLTQKMFYHNHNSTLTDGYDSVNGLNFRKRTRGSRFEDLSKLFYEGIERRIAYHPTFLLYIFIRVLRIVI